MKVLVYLYAYPPFRYTGGELMTADLLESLVRRGHTVDVYCQNLPDDTPYERNGVNVTYSGYLHHTMAVDYDVFITHPEIRTGAMTHVKKLPYIGIVHNTTDHTMRSLERHAPHLTVVNSDFTRNHVPEVAHRTGKGVVVINPPVLLQPDAVRSAEPAYVTAINLSHEKGGAVIDYVAQSRPDTAFLGVIGGHGQQHLPQPPNVDVRPSTGDMRGIYDATKVLLFPTKRESYGKVAAEAMQWGIPMVVSDLPALHEVCDYAAIYADPHDYAGWVTALNRILGSDDELTLWRGRSAERGRALHTRSLEDLDRWESLVKEVAGK